MKIRRFVTGVLAVTILIAAAWSVANIATVAYYYHESRAAWLIGLAFGTANAISVFVFAISERDAAARRPAIVGTIVFGLGSSAIQFHLYNGIEGVSAAVAIWFAALGPAAEALLAWMEAALTADEERRDTEKNQNAWDRIREKLQAAAENATQARIEAEKRLQAVERENEAKRAEIERLRGEIERQLDKGRITQPVTPSVVPDEELSDADLALLTEIREIVSRETIKRAADLQPYVSGLNSLRSTQRALRQAVDAGMIAKNGAGYKIC